MLLYRILILAPLILLLAGCRDKEREAVLDARDAALEKREAFVEERGETLSEWADELDSQQSNLERKATELVERERSLREKEREIQTQLALLDQRKKAFEGKRLELLRGTVPAVTAKHAIVIDVDTGMTLYEKEADAKTAVASTQKLMTALLVTENADLEAIVTVEEDDTAVEPTKLYVSAGDTYRCGDLLEALLVRSCNDVALVLGRFTGGTLDGFIEMMNAKALALGMESSSFKNPHGLTVDGQHSTARDMAKLAVAAYRRPEIKKIVQTEMVNFKMNDGSDKKLTNTNRVLKSFAPCDGMKTGYTRASGFCLICSGQKDGLRRIVVVLGSSSGAVWTDAEKLLEWALRA